MHGAVARTLWEERCRLVEKPDEEELAALGGTPRTVEQRKPWSPADLLAKAMRSLESMAGARHTASCRADAESGNGKPKGAEAFKDAWIETGLARLTGAPARPVVLRRKMADWA